MKYISPERLQRDIQARLTKELGADACFSIDDVRRASWNLTQDSPIPTGFYVNVACKGEKCFSPEHLRLRPLN